MLNILAAIVLVAGSVQTLRVLSEEDAAVTQSPASAVVAVQGEGVTDQGPRPSAE